MLTDSMHFKRKRSCSYVRSETAQNRLISLCLSVNIFVSFFRLYVVRWLLDVECNKCLFTTLAGQSAAFEVALTETPDSLTWLKDNKALEGVDSKRITITSHDDNKVFRLEIKDATLKDMGQYTAVAANCKGKSTCTSHLIVHEC